MRRFNLTLLFFVCSISILYHNSLTAQVESPEVDSTQAQTIDMDYISTESLDILQKIDGITEDLISDDELLQLKQDNDTLISLVKPVLSSSKITGNSSQSTRQLENRLIFWMQEKELVETKMNIISDVLKDLDGSRSYLARKLSEWSKIDEVIEKEASLLVFRPQVTEVLTELKTAMDIIETRSKTIAGLFRKASSLDIEIDKRISDIDKVILSKQRHLLESNQQSFFGINYLDKDNWKISESINNFYKVDLRNLKNYIKSNAGIMFFHALLIIGLILLFIYINKKVIHIEKGESSYFERRLKVILSRPISAALIIGLFASVVIYPNSPLIFNDLMRFLVIFPIVLILAGILHRRYHKYIYAFAAVIILQIIYINMPEDNIISRIILLLINTLEVAGIGHFVLYFKRLEFNKNKLKGIVLALCYILLTMATIGLLGNILGKVMLAELLSFAVAGNILIVVLIALSLLVVNGFVVLFIDSKFAERSNVVKRNKLLLIDKVTGLFNVAAIILLIYYFLKMIGWETAAYDSIIEWFEKERNIGSMVFTWGKLVIFLLVIWLSIVVSKIIRVILEDDVLDKMRLDKGLPHTISMMVRYTIVTVGVFLAVSATGIKMSEFAIIFGAFGVGIGFGLQNIFNNLVSGLILLFERPIKIDDTIEVGTLMGNVKSIGIRSSNVRTFDGAEIIVPNGNLISNEVINWTLSDQTRRIEVIVGVSYSSDPHQVQEILLKVLTDHKDIVNDPTPNVFFRELGESSLDFRMLAWTGHFDQWIRVKSEIIFKVFDALKEANIEIPFPQRDLHVRSIDKDAGLSIKNSPVAKK